MIRLLPSTNPVEESMLIDYCKELQNIGVEFVHCDVMDGKFVSNECLPISLIKKITENTMLGLDVHLMIKDPKEKLKQYMTMNVNIITVHYEAFEKSKDLIRVLTEIKKHGKLAGLSIKPETPVKFIKNFLPILDLVLVMSVEPGKSGQEFMPSTILKIRELRALIDKNKLKIKIEVDGGINEENARAIIQSGADYLVMGNYFYKCKDKKNLIKYIQNIKYNI